MTTKNIDQLRPVVKELLKERMGKTIEARESKELTREEVKAIKDSGLARVIIGEVKKQAPISAPIPPEPEPPKIDPRQAEIERLQALLDEKDKEESGE